MKPAVRHPRQPPSTRVRRICLLLALPLIAFGVESETQPDATAQAGYSLGRYTIDSGGGDASGGGFVMRGSIGQPDVNASGPATGADYDITGGFWDVGVTDRLFRNGFEMP